LDPISIRQAVLQRVVAKLGGTYAAAVQLDVSPLAIRLFLNGAAAVPDAILLRAVDIVLDEFDRHEVSGKSQPFNRSQP
jgi:hypothetical protein